jgi:hypothetical protein
MPEIPDRVPGGVILASYANDIRDRTAQRYASAVERDSLTPLPGEGSLAYLADVDDFQVFANGLWRTLATEDWTQPLLDGIDTRLQELEEVRSSYRSDFVDTTTSLNTSLSSLGVSVTVPFDGTYLVALQAIMEVTSAGQNTVGGVTFSFQDEGVQWESFTSFNVRHDDDLNRPVNVELPVHLMSERAFTAGDTITVLASRSATFTTSGEVRQKLLTLRRV